VVCQEIQVARKIEIDLARVESLAAQGLTEGQIADALGISPRTLTNRKSDSADFAEAIKRGKAKGIAVVTSKLMEQVKGGNVTAMIFFLKTRAGWSERQDADLDREAKKLEVEKLRRELEDPNQGVPEPKQVIIGVEDASDPEAE
jgi:predicted transcriptional regulator